MAFELLIRPIQKYIRDQGWETLRPIQQAAIIRIINTNSNYILASRTASGKTEAAFLPILSKINFDEKGVQVLYISPLIALINDQFKRIEELCEYLDIPVTKWHGEAKISLKNKLIKSPKGIILITPESIEAMFVNKTYYIKHLFSNLKYIVIDEIHSFLGRDRGIQLKSILNRLRSENTNNKFNVVALSATIGDYNEAKKLIGKEGDSKVLLDRTKNGTDVSFTFFKGEGIGLPNDLLQDLYRETAFSKTLIFPNSRGRVEEVAVSLKKIAEKLNGHSNYFAHHSSIHKDVREYVEYFAKTNKYYPFVISCTSTLELGIDIGTVDKIVQINSTNSVSSLIQRLGRSGRKEGDKSNLKIYSTDAWSLVQSLACWLLYEQDIIEPIIIKMRPYDILVHQALSIIKSNSGIESRDLINQLLNNPAFNEIDLNELKEIILHLIECDLIEKIQTELIIGINGEKVVNNRNFYSVFNTEDNLKVIHAGKIIGEIPLTPQIQENENIYLSARIWKIKHINIKAKRIQVVIANDGKRPKFDGDAPIVQPIIREEMKRILFSKKQYDFIDGKSTIEINKVRDIFTPLKLKSLDLDIPVIINGNKIYLYTFTGDLINITLRFLLDKSGIDCTLDNKQSLITLDTTKINFIEKWNNLKITILLIDKFIEDFLSEKTEYIEYSKYGKYLPRKYQIEVIKQETFDIEGTIKFIERSNLVFHYVEVF